jgi:hypothetical protein
MKRLLLPLILFAAFALLLVAIAVDCVRLANAAEERVQMADGELVKHETRLVKLLDAAPQATPEVKQAIAEFRAAKDLHSRHEAYESLVGSFQQSMAETIDATNPLNRKFTDDVVGAFNRRQVAVQSYDEEAAAQRAYLKSGRGQIAQMFSSSARTAAAAPTE